MNFEVNELTAHADHLISVAARSRSSSFLITPPLGPSSHFSQLFTVATDYAGSDYCRVSAKLDYPGRQVFEANSKRNKNNKQ